MSTKFEQLLDYLVNEEMEKANELFHEIVVEKSRDIYENLIAEEDDEEEMEESADDEMDESADDEEMDESAEDDEESMDEGADEEADESVDLEDSYMMDGDDEEDDMGGDATDDFGGDIGATDDEPEMGGEGGEEQAIFDIKNAIQELEAAFAELEKAQGGEMGGDEFDAGDEMGGDEFGGDEKMGSPAFEGRRLREYSEKVGNDWEKNSQKTQGQIVGANTGDAMPGTAEGRSPISSGKGKPTTGASASNILGDQKVGKGTNTGERPDSLNKGIAQVASQKFASGLNNVDGKKSGVKTLSNVKGGHGAEKKGAAPGPVGSGSGDKAGQTSIHNTPSPLNGAPNRNK
jgi:hypothetical protein